MQIIRNFLKPLRQPLLVDNSAAASVATISGGGGDSVSRTLTPGRLASILRTLEQAEHAAIQGEVIQPAVGTYFALAAEMEERDPHYRAVLQTRKLAVTRLQREVFWERQPDDADSAPQIFAATEALVSQPWVGDVISDLTDATAKGYSVVELNWRSAGGQWTPIAGNWRYPQDFWFDCGNTASFVSEQAELVSLPYGKFIVHHATGKTGWVPRRGVAKVAMWSWMLKSFALRDWAAFLDAYGVPWRIGKYHKNATRDQIGKLKGVITRMASDNAAIIPEGMSIEFPNVKPASASGRNPFLELAEYIDKQISKLVLGQTLTTDGGASHAQARVHGEVQAMVVEADARAIARTLTEQLITPFVRLNWGEDAPVPQLELRSHQDENIAERLAHAEVLHKLNIPVSSSQVRKIAKFAAPEVSPAPSPKAS